VILQLIFYISSFDIHDNSVLFINIYAKTKIVQYKLQVDAQTDKVVTYAELQNKVVRCALWLQQQGIKTSDVVSLCSNNHLDAIVPCLAAAYVNAIFNTWNEDMNLSKYFKRISTVGYRFDNIKKHIRAFIVHANSWYSYISTILAFLITCINILRHCNQHL